MGKSLCLVCGLIRYSLETNSIFVLYSYPASYALELQSSRQVPPLLFTMMNENGIDIRIGLASFGGYFVISLFSLVVMGSYDSIVLATFAHEKEEFMTSLQSEEIKRSMSEHDLKLVSLGIGKPNGTTMRRSKSVTHVESVMSV